MTQRIVNAPEAPIPVGYAHAVEVTGAQRLLFISGQVPSTRDGTVPVDFVGQARLVWANLTAQLRAAGMGPEHVVKLTVFLTDRAHLPVHNRVFDEWLGDRVCAVSTLMTGLVRDSRMLEIEAVAAA